MDILLSNGKRVISGPGTEAVADSDQLLAEVAMHYLVSELGGDAEFERAQSLDYDALYDTGRFAFILTWRGQRWEIQMPGVPIEQVRYTKAEGQKCSEFARLYVNGSSWWWCHATDLLADPEFRSDFES